MVINGEIKKIVSDGYERYITVETDNVLLGSLWCYLVDTEMYMETLTTNCSIFIGQQVKLKLSIEWVHDYTVLSLGSNEEESFKQPIQESSHIEAIATVFNLLDEYTLICDIGQLKKIIIEFEEKVTDVDTSDKIKISGNLRAEILIDNDVDY